MADSIRDLDLNLLVVFDAVYTAGNISHAARQLALTQPTVSNAIARLRERLDDPLFVPSGRGVKPTNRSQQMIAPVRDALRLIRQQIASPEAFDIASYRRTFRILVVDPLELLLVPPLLREVASHAPHVAIESRPPSQGGIEQIISGTLDLACYPFLAKIPGIEMFPICMTEYVVVARQDHPGIGKTLDRQTFFRLGHVAFIDELRVQVTVDRDITTRGGKRRFVYFVNKIWSIPAIVGSSDLLGVLPRRFAERMAPIYGLAIYPPPVPIADQELQMIWHEKNNDDPGHRWLREALMGAVREVAGIAAQTPADS